MCALHCPPNACHKPKNSPSIFFPPLQGSSNARICSLRTKLHHNLSLSGKYISHKSFLFPEGFVLSQDAWHYITSSSAVPCGGWAFLWLSVLEMFSVLSLSLSPLLSSLADMKRENSCSMGDTVSDSLVCAAVVHSVPWTGAALFLKMYPPHRLPT